MKADEKKCPQCAEAIKKAAKVCKHCGYQFSEQEIAAQAEKDRKNTVIGCGGAIGLLLLVSTCVALTSDGDTPTANATGNEVVETAEADEAAEEAEKKRKGFHCLSSWDGSHRELVSAFKQTLREPDSFEHIETRISPVSKEGNHALLMQYRARNGFGGMNVGSLTATVKNSDCSFEVIAAGDS